ncbi:hypothetical protein [Kitasatospora sp. NPDC058046]|uniref:hypothetical protein n=1 Tax=Kitasatospora sp. NPDC058046 TaxID=3346312 RepID=UPI0036DE1F4B
MIRVRPAASCLRAFAAWAVAQDPKLRTVSAAEFAVPVELFPVVPEDVLAGAVIDGFPYEPPGEAPVESSAPEPAVEVSAAAGSPAGSGAVCDECGRGFSSARGLDTHRRQAHPEA